MFANEKVRSALEYAVDRVALNKVVFDGLGAPAYQNVPSWSPGYSKSLGSSDAYNPVQGEGDAQGGRLPQGREVHVDHPIG